MSELLVWLDYHFAFGFVVKGYSSIVSCAHPRHVRAIGFYVQSLLVLYSIPGKVWIARCTPHSRNLVWLRVEFERLAWIHSLCMRSMPIPNVRSMYTLGDVLFMAVEVTDVWL